MLLFDLPARHRPSFIHLVLAFCSLFLGVCVATAETTSDPIVITFSDLDQPRTYTGQDQEPASFSISPGSLENYNVKVTYNGKTALPKNAGSYAIKVVATEKVAAPGKKPRTATATAPTKLLVGKAPLSVMADDSGRLFGAPNPKFTFSYDGFLNGETFAVLDRKPTATTTAKSSSPVGEYPINVIGGADLNYEIVTRNPGKLYVVSFAAGPHEALIMGDFGDAPQGRIDVTLPSKGTIFTGRLHLASLPSPLAFKGNLVLAPDTYSATALVTLQLKPKGALPYRFFIRVTVDELNGLVLTLERSESPYEFTDSVATVGSAHAVRIHHKTNNPAPWAGTHTLILNRPGDAGDTELRPFPEGASYASAIIGLDGNLTLRGKLADGTTLTATLYSDAEGAYLVFLRPYGTRLDSRLSGRLELTPHLYLIEPQRYKISGDGTNELHWLKAAKPGSKPDAVFPLGFGPISVLATLDPWLPPVINKKDPSATITLAQRLALAESADEEGSFDIFYGSASYGEMEWDLPESATLGTTGSVKPVLYTDKNITAWKMNVTASTGVFSGSFVLKETEPKRVSRTIQFQGILRQGYEDGATIGAGHAIVKPIPGDIFDTETVSANIELLTQDAFGF